MVKTLTGRSIVPGRAVGRVLLSSRPLSLWGGINPVSGRIIDRRHDRHGESVTGRVFAFPGEKGSSTGSAVLLELIRTGQAPCAILTTQLSPILALGAIVADELYGRTIPIFQIGEADFGALCDGQIVQVAEDGSVTLAT